MWQIGFKQEFEENNNISNSFTQVKFRPPPTKEAKIFPFTNYYPWIYTPKSQLHIKAYKIQQGFLTTPLKENMFINLVHFWFLQLEEGKIY